MDKKYKVVFVCHGNICRSPMAEFIFRDMLEKNNMENDVYVCSRATSTSEIRNGIGDPVYPPAVKELAKHGLSCDGKRAVQLTHDDYGKYDMIIIMDTRNYNDTLKIVGDDPEKKIRKLMEFTDRSGDVADPWFTCRFEIAFNDIYDGCSGLIKFLSGLKEHGELVSAVVAK